MSIERTRLQGLNKPLPEPALMFSTPLPLSCDWYKHLHHFQYQPNLQKIIVYSEFRKSFCASDKRIALYGVGLTINQLLGTPITLDDLERTDTLLKKVGVDGSHQPSYPRQLFLDVILEYGGYLPIKIEALPDGSVIYPHVPFLKITASGRFSALATYIESVISHFWYPTSVCTYSRFLRSVVEAFFERTVDNDRHQLAANRVHDFGLRGCTCLDQAIIGGSAHLMNFEGTDNLPACCFVNSISQSPVGCSVPAAEHSVILLSNHSELETLKSILARFVDCPVSLVADTYDYQRFLCTYLPELKAIAVRNNIFLVIRPDSGDPVETVLDGMQALDRVFGSTINSKGYKVISGAGVIQADQMDMECMERIYTKLMQLGFSAENIVFGIGTNLLQKMDRNLLGCVTKVCYFEDSDGTPHDVMKNPKTDTSKQTIPGNFDVVYGHGKSSVMVVPVELSDPGESLFTTVYNNGPVGPRVLFEEMRARLASRWPVSDKNPEVISEKIREKMKKI